MCEIIARHGMAANPRAEIRNRFILRGDVYAIKLDGRIIFLHQVWVVSCLACNLYDCDGNKIQPSTIDVEKLVAGMVPANRIYSSGLK